MTTLPNRVWKNSFHQNFVIFRVMLIYQIVTGCEYVDYSRCYPLELLWESVPTGRLADDDETGTSHVNFHRIRSVGTCTLVWGYHAVEALECHHLALLGILRKSIGHCHPLPPTANTSRNPGLVLHPIQLGGLYTDFHQEILRSSGPWHPGGIPDQWICFSGKRSDTWTGNFMFGKNILRTMFYTFTRFFSLAPIFEETISVHCKSTFFRNKPWWVHIYETCLGSDDAWFFSRSIVFFYDQDHDSKLCFLFNNDT